MGNLRKKGREDMGFWELVVLAVGLSMDAFAVSICKGLALQRVSWKECCIAGAWFGGFQALMPLLGYLLGTPPSITGSRSFCWASSAAT